MNKTNKIILFIILVSFVISFMFYYFMKNNEDKKNAIFNIVSKKNINLDSTNLKTNNYKNIRTTKKVGNGFFINTSGEFLTSKHVLNNNYLEYFIKIENTNYEFEVIKKYKNKDIVLGKIKKYKNNNFISINKVALANGNNIFIIKNNKQIYGKIIGIDESIKLLNLNNVIETNLKLSPGDSGSPIFNKNYEIIGIASAINEFKNTSFIQKL